VRDGSTGVHTLHRKHSLNRGPLHRHAHELRIADKHPVDFTPDKHVGNKPAQRSQLRYARRAGKLGELGNQVESRAQGEVAPLLPHCYHTNRFVLRHDERTQRMV
jgi:hypothetical protein